ncbi:MAG TPA: tRNA adenosine(34) deaminase TadA [Gemmatimonadales bacterium]|nr:tRNA adenosine(34) deaminase TadA [Gemmatimonadales bacterium]
MRRGPPSPADAAGMEAALRLARAASVREEVPVGAVVLREGVLLAEAHNETIQRRDPTAHAELLAVQRALSHAGEDRLVGATLFVTLEPCAQCAGAIILAKVSRVVFGAWDSRAGMAGSIHDLLRHPRLNHHPEVIGGILEAECGELLKRFFHARRWGREHGADEEPGLA